MIDIISAYLCKDTGTLRISVKIKGDSYYKDVFIDKIIIDNNNTFSPQGPGENPVYTATVKEDLKFYHIDIPASMIAGGIYRKILYIYAIARGVPGSDTPCGADDNTTLKVVADFESFYKRLLRFLPEMEKKCDIPMEFTDSYLRMTGVKLAVTTCNYAYANYLWGMFNVEKSDCGDNLLISKPCGCNG